MYSVRADQAKNRLYIVLDGFISAEEAQEAAAAIKAGADQLQQGFDIINDIRTFKPGSPRVAAIISETQAYVIQQGVKRTVRIVGDDVITAMQWHRVSKESGAVFIEATSLEKAEALLDET